MKKVILVLILSKIAMAAIPNKAVLQPQNTLELLNLKFEKRKQIVETNLDFYKNELEKIAFQKEEHLSYRWRALTSLARIYKTDSVPYLEKALKSTDWFMRDAALKSAKELNLEQLNSWSLKALNDPALVVRTTAVKNLSFLNKNENRSVLWKAISDKQNFKNSQSLWVRKHIALALSDASSKINKETLQSENSNWIKLLSDQDKKIQEVAAENLAKNNDLYFSEKLSFQLKKQNILDWWKQQ